ncbi:MULTISPECIES: hypothetical protein [unclassified Anaeromyxobacter]|uniref:hypothetical protein n=1 Tax=unclassified Anaeromyxobacter TaxID=2620896 RepID=UPI001F5621FD|nr:MULTISPECIES: hypothetical protein [unclassified Anaeromyxobacter]
MDEHGPIIDGQRSSVADEQLQPLGILVRQSNVARRPKIAMVEDVEESSFALDLEEKRAIG